MKAFTAELSEILLAERRDEDEIEHLIAELSQIVKDLFGSQFWISYWNYYPIIANTVYYAVTTLSAVQTVGEEYVSLLPLAPLKDRKLPSFTRRFIFLLCYAIAPFLTEKALKRIEQILENSLTKNGTYFYNRNSDLRKKLLSFLVWIRLTGIPALYRLNLTLFYLFGTYYSISKRLISLQYVSFRSQSNFQAQSYFRFFGAVTVAQIILSTVIWIRNELRKSYQEEGITGINQSSESEFLEDENDLFANNWFCCSLCSQYNKPPACIPCGHLFCWNCISKHIQYTAVDSGLSFCPQCRREFHPSRVAPLLNL